VPDLPTLYARSARTAPLWLLAFVVLGLALTACGTGRTPHALLELAGPTMGTTYSIKVVDPPAHLHRDTLAALVEAELTDLLQKLSTYDPASELSRFNQSRETDWIDASEELVEVLGEARQVSELTDGAFDVTVGPLVDLWGFGPELTGDRIPTAAEIAVLQAGLGFRNIEVRAAPPAIRKLHPDTRIDLSAIAKGYAVDRLALLLESRGISSYLVEIGGELRGRGHNPSGDHWRIGIERPVAGERAVHDVITIDNVGVATSGDYRNYFEKDGQRFSHTIDPHTGRPVTHTLAAVTVISPQTMRADAMATALMVLGPDAGYTLADREGLAALFVVRSADGFVDRHTSAYTTHRFDRKT
jgi:thiamine biosynthesis lipoprotein